MEFYAYSETLPDNIPTPVISGLRLPLIPIEIPPKPTTPLQLSLRIKHENNVYDFPPIIKKFLEPALPRLHSEFTKKYYNSRMLRLKKYDGALHTEMTYYFEHRLIHHDADRAIYRGQTIRDTLEDFLFEEIENPEKESIFPNGLGANILIITADNYMIIPKRSKNVSVAKNKYAPSLTFGLIHKNETDIIGWNIRNALLREYNYVPTKGSKTLYLGLFRDLYTMGSPEAYFLMKITEGIGEFEAKITEENRKIEAIEIDDIATYAEAIAYDFPPEKTSEHIYAILYLISNHSKEL